MKRSRKNQYFILFLSFLFIISQLSSISSENKIDNLINKESQLIIQESDESPIRIKEITNQGLGLSFIIENSGERDISNINIEIESINGIVIIPNNQIELTKLSAKTEKKITMLLFGFGIGINQDFPRFLLTISSNEIKTIEMEIMANVIGPYIEIILKYLRSGISYEGYTLFSPMWGTESYLITNKGDIVHSWSSSIYSDAQTSYLMENGNLIRTSLVVSSSFPAGGYQGRVEIYDWNDTAVWIYEYSTDQYCSHHDVTTLPNGNVLIISWELKSTEEAIAEGKNPEQIQGYSFWPDKIIEVEPTSLNEGNIVWEWHAWDHIIQDFDPSKNNYGNISAHPELIDINYGGRRSDWLHINSVDYNEELDQILLSVHNFNEIWIIDHSTTTQEAAGHIGGRYGKGGDLLYRWGNPQAYGRGIPSDQKLFGQHDATWIPLEYPGGGNIILFNNDAGNQNGRYSTVDEIKPPIDENGFYKLIPGEAFGPKNQIWIYNGENSTQFFSPMMSGTQRLANGNTILCSATSGLFYEVTYQKEVVWTYYNPYPIGFFNSNVGKIRRYGPDYPGLKFLN